MFSIIPHALGSLGQQQKRRVSDKKKFLEKQIGGPKMLQTYLYKWMETSRVAVVYDIVFKESI